jgi:hypothetical protein
MAGYKVEAIHFIGQTFKSTLAEVVAVDRKKNKSLKAVTFIGQYVSTVTFEVTGANESVYYTLIQRAIEAYNEI